MLITIIIILIIVILPLVGAVRLAGSNRRVGRLGRTLITAIQASSGRIHGGSLAAMAVLAVVVGAAPAARAGTGLGWLDIRTEHAAEGFIRYIVKASTDGSRRIAGMELSFAADQPGTLGQQNPLGLSTLFTDNNHYFALDPASNMHLDSHWMFSSSELVVLPTLTHEDTSAIRCVMGLLNASFLERDILQLVLPVGAGASVRGHLGFSGGAQSIRIDASFSSSARVEYSFINPDPIPPPPVDDGGGADHGIGAIWSTPTDLGNGWTRHIISVNVPDENLRRIGLRVIPGENHLLSQLHPSVDGELVETALDDSAALLDAQFAPYGREMDTHFLFGSSDVQSVGGGLVDGDQLFAGELRFNSAMSASFNLAQIVLPTGASARVELNFMTDIDELHVWPLQAFAIRPGLDPTFHIIEMMQIPQPATCIPLLGILIVAGRTRQARRSC